MLVGEIRRRQGYGGQERRWTARTLQDAIARRRELRRREEGHSTWTVVNGQGRIRDLHLFCYKYLVAAPPRCEPCSQIKSRQWRNGRLGQQGGNLI
jgi:hypothetical protein